ncbi:MAG TPA: thermonuclease family protein [Actinomycetota bacterium]|nr:thermonuclease family protein [Actinomycetota bacterium]
MLARGAVLGAVVAVALSGGCSVEGPDVPAAPTGVPEERDRPGEDDHRVRPPRRPSAPGRRLVPVLRVVDGDTLHVLRRGRDETIRLIGIDTPEVDWYGGRAECFGAVAGRFLTGLLQGERVRLEFDEERIDPYGRTLAYLYLEDGRFLNLLLVRRGFATVTIYEPNDRHEDRLRAAEEAARSSEAGLWSACPVP